MALNLKKSAAARNAEMNALVTLLSSGAKLCLYSGAQPTNVATALGAQVLLAELGLPNPVGTVSGGVLTFGTITNDSSANANGTAAWFSIKLSDDTREIEGTVGTSGCDLTIDNTSINLGQVVSASGLTLTAGNA